MSEILYMWKNNGDIGLYHTMIDQTTAVGKSWYNVFLRFFGMRDIKYGEPNHPRYDDGTFHFDLIEFAEAFYPWVSPEKFSRMVNPYLNDAPPEQLTIANILSFRELFHPGYVVGLHNNTYQKQGGKPRGWKYWQLFCQEKTNEELAKIIPNRFQSKSRTQGFDDRYDITHVSPMLKWRHINGLRDYVHDKLSGGSETIGYQLDSICKNGVTIDAVDAVRAATRMKGSHPLIIIDNWPGEQVVQGVRKTQDALEEEVWIHYPAMREQTDMTIRNAMGPEHLLEMTVGY